MVVLSLMDTTKYCQYNSNGLKLKSTQKYYLGKTYEDFKLQDIQIQVFIDVKFLNLYNIILILPYDLT